MSTPPILLCGRPDLLTKPGGDTLQIRQTLAGLGPRARLSLDLSPDLCGVQLVHLFNLSRPVEPALQFRHARRAGVTVVCTPIFQDLTEYNRRGRRGIGRLVFAALGGRDDRLEDARALVNLRRSGAVELWRRPRFCGGLLAHALSGRGVSAVDLQREVVRGSAAVLVNSDLEAETVGRRLGGDPARGHLVPVGVDPAEFDDADPSWFVRRYGLRDFVISVGRIEDLKNQLTLLRALEKLDLPLVLVGGRNPAHRGYARAVDRAVARRLQTLHIPGLSRPHLASALAAAAVHVLPSWVETAGLVSLEAALCRCAVVSTDRGYTRAYLGPHAHYCDPSDPVSIRRAVERALETGPSEALRRRVLRRFSLNRVDSALAAVYDKVSRRPARP